MRVFVADGGYALQARESRLARRASVPVRLRESLTSKGQTRLLLQTPRGSRAFKFVSA